VQCKPAHHQSPAYTTYTLADLSQFFSILSDLNAIGVPSQASQIMFEMQSQRISQKKSSKEKTFFLNCKMRFFFSFFFIFDTSYFQTS
jgi:hypothetical protein